MGAMRLGLGSPGMLRGRSFRYFIHWILPGLIVAVFSWPAVLGHSSSEGMPYPAVFDPENMTGRVWEMNVSGLTLDGSDYDPNAQYSMKLQILDHWALSNWYRNLVPNQGNGFIFLNLTLTNYHEGSARIGQHWEMRSETGTVIRPYEFPLPLEGSVSDLYPLRNLRWSVGNRSSAQSLIVFEATPSGMPYILHIDKLGANDHLAGEILQLQVNQSSVQYPQTRQAYRYLNLLPARMVAEGAEAYDVTADRNGNILLAYGDGTLVTLATLSTISLNQSWSYQTVCQVPDGITSISVMEDSSGTDRVVIATARPLQSSPSASGIASVNVSLWLCSRNPGSSLWSGPRRIYNQIWRGEARVVALDLSLEEDSCGTFWIFCNRPGRAYIVTHFIKSYDRGATWTAGQRFFDAGSDTRFDSLLVDGAGALRVVYRSRLYTPSLNLGEVWQTISLDCGKSWEPPERLLAYMETRFAAVYEEPISCESCEPSEPSQETASRLWFLWQNDIVGRGYYYLEYSEDGGKTWHAYGLLGAAGRSAPRPSFGKLSSRQQPGDSLYLFWSQNSNIYCAPVNEWIWLVPTTKDAALELGSLIRGAKNDLVGSLEYIPQSAAHLMWALNLSQDALDRAEDGLNDGNWTEAAVQFCRARNLLEPVLELASLIAKTRSLLEEEEREGFDVSIVESWYWSAIGLIEDGQDEKAVSALTSILALGEDGCRIADEMTKIENTLIQAAGQGLDVSGADAYLTYAISYLKLGYMDLARQTLDNIRNQWSDIFQASENSVVLILAGLMASLGAPFILGHLCKGEEPSAKRS